MTLHVVAERSTCAMPSRRSTRRAWPSTPREGAALQGGVLRGCPRAHQARQQRSSLAAPKTYAKKSARWSTAALISQLMSVGTHQSKHVISELVRSIFDVDKMLYFVAPNGGRRGCTAVPSSWAGARDRRGAEE